MDELANECRSGLSVSSLSRCRITRRAAGGMDFIYVYRGTGQQIVDVTPPGRAANVVAQCVDCKVEQGNLVETLHREPLHRQRHMFQPPLVQFYIQQHFDFTGHWTIRHVAKLVFTMDPQGPTCNTQRTSPPHTEPRSCAPTIKNCM